MRPSIYVHAIIKETNSLYSTNIKIQISHIIHTARSCSFLTSAAIMEVQMGEGRKKASVCARVQLSVNFSSFPSYINPVWFIQWRAPDLSTQLDPSQFSKVCLQYEE
jgi:hypothetical protein